MANLTEHEVVTLGDYSASLMRHDSFNTLCDIFRAQAFEGFMGSEPHESKRRESIYAETWALQKFLGLMKGFVDQSEDIRAASEGEPQDDDNTEEG